MTDMSVDIGGGVLLKNPVLTASGTFGYGEEFQVLYDLANLGGIVTKAITPEERFGNLIPRIAETECGMLNSIGLANVGLENFLTQKVPALRQIKTEIFVNVAGKELEHYVLVAERLNDLDFISGIEVNISCPNVKEGGLAFGADPFIAAKVIKAVRKVYKKHIMVKLTPNVTDITIIAAVVEAEGADSLSVINTLLGMAIDVNTFKPKVRSITAGYSGPGIKPVALACVYRCSQAVKIPVIGMGGIRNHTDVIEFMLAGASAVQVGTANFTDPLTANKIVDNLELYMMSKKIDRISSLIGGMIV